MLADRPVHQTIGELLDCRARDAPEAVALLAPGRPPCTYTDLVRQMTYVISQLNRAGIGRNDRVAVVLKNGPELAAAFVSVAAAAACAPLNPDYREAEFDFYLSDLNAKAVLIAHNADSPVRDVALKHGIPIIELVPEDNRPSGSFSLKSSTRQECMSPGPAQADDTALVLHTSGTTSRPKLVPLTQANLCTSAHNVSSTLRLLPTDRCLNVMPLFHIHGLVASTLASLAAGASVICTSGWNQSEFLTWLEGLRPTWYTAVPTIHQSVLAAVRKPIPAQHSLRLIRSSSASLPPQLLHDLELAFGIPVIEAYGMTEAAHQMCCNPLPPAARKAGSVGLPAGPEVGVMNEAGDLLGANVVGEFVIRGANVTAGYENNVAANEAAFMNGWFRTGDQGYRDADGYYFLKGRLKELINRGGEKIAPREVDEALLTHPSVAQAVAFAIPHPRLGEDLAAAVVLRADATERELRSYALERLAPHKVPSRIIFVDAIPKGPTGKLQRVGLGETLSAKLQIEFVPPQSPIEQALARIWNEVLDLEKIGAHDNFFYVGGDSLLASRVQSRIRAMFEIDLSITAMFEAPTIAEQAVLVEDHLVTLVEGLPEQGDPL